MEQNRQWVYPTLSVVYLVMLAALMWLPLQGLKIPMDNFVLGIRIDHLYHATVYVPCVLMLMPLCRYRWRRAWLVALLVALTTETVQWLLPYRGFDINDLIANLLGVTVGVLLVRMARYREKFIES